MSSFGSELTSTLVQGVRGPPTARNARTRCSSRPARHTCTSVPGRGNRSAERAWAAAAKGLVMGCAAARVGAARSRSARWPGDTWGSSSRRMGSENAQASGPRAGTRAPRRGPPSPCAWVGWDLRSRRAAGRGESVGRPSFSPSFVRPRPRWTRRRRRPYRAAPGGPRGSGRPAPSRRARPRDPPGCLGSFCRRSSTRSR